MIALNYIGVATDYLVANLSVPLQEPAIAIIQVLPDHTLHLATTALTATTINELGHSGTGVGLAQSIGQTQGLPRSG